MSEKTNPSNQKKDWSYVKNILKYMGGGCWSMYVGSSNYEKAIFIRQIVDPAKILSLLSSVAI